MTRTSRRGTCSATLLALLLVGAGVRGESAVTAVQGEISFLERSGQNIYLELRAGGKTVGVELLPRVARAVGGKLKQGIFIGVKGRRLKGEKEIAFVVEVDDPQQVELPRVGGAPRLPLRALVPRVDPPPAAPVVMLAGLGMWPPMAAGEIADQVSAARRDGVGRMVIDTGLTELARAYRSPEPFLRIVAQAAAEARRQGVPAAFYFPAFEVRKEKEDRHKESLLGCCRSWAQLTLAGKPYLKTSFGKEEFWNRQGDEVLWVCPNSPWREVFKRLLVEAVRRGAETIFIDVPYLQLSASAGTCRCPGCVARFKKETGQVVPTRLAPGSAAHHRWLWWRHQTILAFLGDLRRALRQANPRAQLVVEEYPSTVDRATTERGLEIALAGGEVDLFAHEYSAKQFDRAPFSRKDRVDLAAALALYRGLDGRRPTWVLSYAHDPRGSRASAALHLAYDASFWETKGPEMNGTTVGQAWRQQLFTWFATNRYRFGCSQQLADVAVLYSPASRDFSADHFTTLWHTMRALIEAQIPFRVLATRDLEELRHYRVLVLPGVTALGPGEASALRSSSAQLLGVGPLPGKDEWGIAARDHRLKLRRVDLGRLPAAVGSVPVLVEGAAVAVNLVQRASEVQIRLAHLEEGSRQVRVRVKLAGVRDGSVLSLLGKETKLALERRGDELSMKVTLQDLTMIRLVKK